MSKYDLSYYSHRPIRAFEGGRTAYKFLVLKDGRILAYEEAQGCYTLKHCLTNRQQNNIRRRAYWTPGSQEYW